MANLRVLVVGASIAGPATAYWLSKAGARVTVIERSPSLRPGGQAIDIRTAGVSVMRQMPGMEAAVRAKSTQEEGVSFVREDGRPFGVIRMTGNPDQQSLISEYEILRGDLATVLFDLTKDNKKIEYVFNEQIASMQSKETEDGPLTVNFANGRSSADYDLVVACDGANSKTRAMALGCGVRDHVFSSGCWTAYFSVAEDVLSGSKIAQGYNGPQGRSISLGTDPAGFSRVMLMCFPPGKPDEATIPFREAAAKGETELQKYLSQHYGDMGWKTPELMRDMMDSQDFYASEVVQVKVPKLYNGRLALVGDAGYAAGLTGGGTSLALAGAYILAGELSKCSGDVAAGLQGYEKNMRPLIKEMQVTSPLLSTFMAPQTAWGIWIRNYVFAFIAWTGIAEFLQKSLGGGFSSTDKFPLPKYEWKE